MHCLYDLLDGTGDQRSDFVAGNQSDGSQSAISRSRHVPRQPPSHLLTTSHTNPPPLFTSSSPLLPPSILLLLLLSKVVVQSSKPSSPPPLSPNRHLQPPLLLLLLLMEKAERETHDFMNVDTFSQLPFIRPAPVKEKGIRLFGIEFSGGGDTTALTTDESDSADTNNPCEELVLKDNNNNNNNNNNDNGESSRKFECHYCCRNFPTSQALGGHQNAHKRERQHAKRAHLQSAMVHGGFSDVYGLMNYPHHRLGSATAPPNPATMTYHHHNPYANTTPRFYGSHHGGGAYSHHHHHQPPINGSPLALWRIPAVQNSPTLNRDRSMHHPLPLFASDDLKPSPMMGSSSSQSRYGYEAKSTVQDHVSLDLHL
ncbi:Zinc finger protein GIS [Camellia lanceoleosa]|uniref:Zinc finger protein GIS n=1 Tax=Camellia lanceoleosa TaxID=1840588 RepID=A0ACC0G6D2_9ERIC|nr:Zinc finger protein GIS [Camellia lanceoleosa]